MKVVEEVIDFENAPEVKDALLKAVAAGDLTVDLSEVKRADSAALSALLSAARRAESSGKRLVIERVPADLETLARLYGVEALLGLSPQKEADAH